MKANKTAQIRRSLTQSNSANSAQSNSTKQRKLCAETYVKRVAQTLEIKGTKLCPSKDGTAIAAHKNLQIHQTLSPNTVLLRFVHSISQQKYKTKTKSQPR